MAILLWVLTPLQVVLDAILRIGRAFGIIAIAMMVIAILLQVFFRYVLNDALSWPDEAARFMMLWLTGLVAPAAYRRGGFVAIDMVVAMLPRIVGAVLSLFLLFVAAIVLWVALKIGWAEVTGFGGRFTTDSLWLIGLDGEWFKVPRKWMMFSMVVGTVLMLFVNIELIIRSMITLGGGEAKLRPIMDADMAGAE
jgi:TRAP-type C4-dicarboxylate transport system permease small subunit